MLQLPRKTMLASKVVKSDSKILRPLCKTKFVAHSVQLMQNVNFCFDHFISWLNRQNHLNDHYKSSRFKCHWQSQLFDWALTTWCTEHSCVSFWLKLQIFHRWNLLHCLARKKVKEHSLILRTKNQRLLYVKIHLYLSIYSKPTYGCVNTQTHTHTFSLSLSFLLSQTHSPSFLLSQTHSLSISQSTKTQKIRELHDRMTLG